MLNIEHKINMVNPTPVDRWFIPLFIRFQPSKVVQDFSHQQYDNPMKLVIEPIPASSPALRPRRARRGNMTFGKHVRKRRWAGGPL